MDPRLSARWEVSWAELGGAGRAPGVPPTPAGYQECNQAWEAETRGLRLVGRLGLRAGAVHPSCR